MDIRLALRQKLPELPKKLALAARYALDHPDRIALDSMRSTATTIGVTSPTMLRLARQMGFNSYEDFRASFQEELVATGFGVRAGALRSGEAGGNTRTVSEKMLSGSEANIQTTMAQLDADSLSTAANAIRQARVCYLIGSGSMSFLTAIIQLTGSMILPNLRHVGMEYLAVSEAFAELGKEDTVLGIGLNPCSRRTVDAMRFAREAGARTIAITDRPSSPLAVGVDHAFFARTDSPHYYPSMVALMVVIETLLATVVATGGDDELERIKVFEKLRQQSDSYVEY